MFPKGSNILIRLEITIRVSFVGGFGGGELGLARTNTLSALLGGGGGGLPIGDEEPPDRKDTERRSRSMFIYFCSQKTFRDTVCNGVSIYITPQLRNSRQLNRR